MNTLKTILKSYCLWKTVGRCESHHVALIFQLQIIRFLRAC